jgi:hypothetical protein
MRGAIAIACLALSCAVTVTAQRSDRTQRGNPAPRSDIALPPVSMTCVHHPDVIESRAGTCPLCRMALVPVRLDSAWMCPIHSVVQEKNAGTCRLCRRPLVQVTLSLTWTCRGEADAEHIDPGPCADGTPRMARRSLRPHGNHNAQHGGQFFMAPDNWHHLEATYPRDRVFRLYLYDDYSRALKTAALKAISARVVTSETFDPATRRTTELKAFPLIPSRDGTYLEARVDPTTLPAEMTAKVRFAKDAPEYRFDFTFTGITKDPAIASIAPTNPRIAPTSEATVSPAFAELPPPTSLAEILAQLRIRSAEIGTLIKRGDFGAVWVPAFAAKELAVLLEPRAEGLPAARRLAAEPALRDVVRASWLLDSVGDAGNRQNVEQAFATFSTAVTQTLAAFAETQ